MGAVLLLAACSGQNDAPSPSPTPSPTPTPVAPVKAEAKPAALESHTGLASWYGKAFDGKPTASGRTFDSKQPMAAHPHWPFGTRVKVTNLDNQREFQVLVVDRGPAEPQQNKGVLIDLSRSAAEKLEFVDQGIAEVRLDVLEWGDPDDAD